MTTIAEAIPDTDVPLDVPVDKLVAVERKITAAMEELQTKMDDIESQRKEVRSTILSIMNARGEDSVKTAHGTVSRTIKERIWTNDWAPLHNYILEHGAVDLLEKRIHQTNMRQWMDQHPDDYPPALNVDREYTITIRNPRKAKEQ
jgi:hypothetical protein